MNRILNHFYTIVLELFDFVRNPKDERMENRSFKQKVTYVFSFWVIKNVFFFIVLLPFYYLINYIEPLVGESRIDYDKNTIGFMIFAALIFAPLFEELLFRGILRYKSFYPMKRQTWDKYFKYLVYFSILIFGVIHSSNYENSSVFFYCIVPLVTISQTIGGIVLSFLRVRFSLWTAILYHSIWNFTAVFFISSLFSLFQAPYIKTNKNYTVKIEQFTFVDLDNQKMDVACDGDKIVKLKSAEYSINHILDSVCDYKSSCQDYMINLELKSTQGLSKEEVKEILLDYYQKELQY